MKKLKTILFALFLLSAVNLNAQFYSIGDEDGTLKWMQISTPHYRLIYPKGLDSLSLVYAHQLERYWETVGLSAGYQPGENFFKKTPVVLHAQHGISNGSVAVAPMRMDLFTLPQAYNPGPMPWEQSLAVHESRHVSQMQFGRDKVLKPFNWLFGQMFSGAMSAVYPNMHLLEGDAVVAETALTSFGRGRETQFLNYYMTAFDEGDWRSWYQWRYGSYKRHAPDHYSLGYLTIAGTRYCYGYPDFTKDYFDSVTRQPWRLFHMQRTIRKASGKKFKDSFKEITTTFHDIWKEEQETRRPFNCSELLLPEPRWYTEYSEVSVGSDAIYALKTGKLHPCELVKIERSGKETVLQQFSYAAGGLYLAEDKIWWSESIPDQRWNLKMNSIIRYLDLNTGKIHDLTKEGRYFNPCASPERDLIAVAEYETDGRNSVVLLSSNDGDVRYRFRCPDGMQPSEFTWEDQMLFFNAVTTEGTGLYRIKDFKIEEVLAPQPVRISDLASEKSRMYFSSDRNGVNEMYELDYNTGNIYQLISLEYGGSDFSFNTAVDHLFYTVPGSSGTLLHRTPKSELTRKKVDWNEVHTYRVAEKLTEQEKQTAKENHFQWPDDSTRLAQVQSMEYSTPRPYRKGLKLFNFHSWAPVYVDGDVVTSLDMGNLYTTCGIGATAFFQSVLGDATGSVGYQYGRTGERGQYRSSGHLSFTYSGWYPVLQCRLDFGERHAYQYFRNTYLIEDKQVQRIGVHPMSTPSLRGRITGYIPLNYSSGGWQRGVVPKLSYAFSNDAFNKSQAVLDLNGTFGPHSFGNLTDYKKSKTLFMQTLDLSLRAYTLQHVAPAKVYPDWGVGGEIGWSGRLGLTEIFSSSLYAYLYAYLPGFWKNQGWRISGTYQHQFKMKGMLGENRLDLSPRGFVKENVNQVIAPISTDQVQLSADYSIPIYIGDIDWFCPFFYIKNLELRPYIDYSYVQLDKGLKNQHLFSAGSELTVHSANLLWIPYETAFGITCCYNGGSLMKFLKPEKNHYIGFVFRISM